MNKNYLKYCIILIIAIIIIGFILLSTTPSYGVKKYNNIILLNNNKISEATINIFEKQWNTINLQQVTSNRNISHYDIGVYTDLSIMRTINKEQINRIIYELNPDSPFNGHGQIFIDASKASGLDPIYILAHAAIESAWGTSEYAIYYHNYFGIGAFNYDPDNAINYGNDDMREGIINGAVWISNNYYNEGQTNLYTMRYNNGEHEYCTDPDWMYIIADIISDGYSLIS